ncbi:MAG: hypothetical protein KME14_18610 [Tildeniella torsiva UHER 1998/13D]|jgi:hypothetical protein|nr:hypothetical protein [Tildeniella torsiva UHER 1998/13D]
MPVVFDEVVGTVAAPPAAAPAEGSAAEPSPLAAEQTLRHWWHNREARLARLRAD